VAGSIGVSDTGLTIWNIAKWPFLIAAVLLLLAILYHAPPNARESDLRWVSAGSLVALVAWAVSSVLFGIYVSKFGSYGKTYGSLAGVIVLLVWLWITNLAVLFGHQLNAERARGDTSVP
jgi:membrane protein